jgi:hypothetical protein
MWWRTRRPGELRGPGGRILHALTFSRKARKERQDAVREQLREMFLAKTRRDCGVFLDVWVLSGEKLSGWMQGRLGGGCRRLREKFVDDFPDAVGFSCLVNLRAQKIAVG